MKKCSIIIMMMTLLSPVYVAAAGSRADSAETSYFSMSLEDLMGITVVTPSTFDQKVQDACATIDVITADQLRDLGVDNLYDALGSLSGIEIMETYYGYTDVQFRGILQSHYNNKSSLLLNGQPLYDEIISSYYLEQIPLLAVKQIEVVRGPGSVLYGTNAFAGVINVITNDGGSMNGSVVSLKSGTFNTKKARYAFGREVNGVDLFFAGEFNESDGYQKTVIWDEDDSDLAAGTTGQRPYGNRFMGFYPDDRDSYENDYISLFTSAGYRGLEANVIYFDNKKDKFGIIPTLVSTGERSIHGLSANARFHQSFSDGRVSYKGIVWHDRIEKDERINSYPPVTRAPGVPHDQQYGGHKTGLQTQFSYSFSNRTHLLGGVGYEDSHSDPYVFVYTDSISDGGDPVQNLAANAFSTAKQTNDLWVFLQASHSLFDAVDFQAGGRINSNKQAGIVTCPSLGLVVRPNDRLALRCLYGAGFRNPSFFEKYVRTVDVLAGDQNLEPEKINTLELGFDYTHSGYSLRVNGFYTRTNNLIVRRPLTDIEIDELNAQPGYGADDMTWTKGYVYYNRAGCVYRGVEIDMRAVVASGLGLQGNITYKTGEDDNNNELQYFAPFHANFSMQYSPANRVNLALSGQYIAEREGNFVAGSPWQTWPDGSSGGTDYILNAYTILRARLGIRPTAPVEISLIVNNILDEEYFYPEYIRRSIPFIPGGPGRSFFVGIDYLL